MPLKAFLSMKFWNREYSGGVFAEICGRFHDIANGGGPRSAMRFRRGSNMVGEPRDSSPRPRMSTRLSRETIV